MRKFPTPLLVLPLLLTIVGCGPVEGGGRLSDGTDCVEYTYSNVAPPTATTVIDVTVWPCPTEKPTSTVAPTTTPITTSTVRPSPTSTTTAVRPSITTIAPPSTTTTTTTTMLGVYPNPSNTGARIITTFAVISGDYAAPAGAVIEGKRITGRLIVGGGGATIRNSEIYGGITNYPSGGRYTVTDSTIGAPTGCNGGIGLASENYTAERVHVRSFGDAFRGSTTTGASDILIRDSYALLCSQPGFHSDGYQGYQAGTNVKLIHNTLDQRGAPDSTAPIFNADGSKALWAEDNLVAGGGFSLRVYDVPGQKSTVRDNKVVDGSWQYGPVNSSCGDQWTGNTIVRIDSEYRVTSTVRSMPCGG